MTSPDAPDVTSDLPPYARIPRWLIAHPDASDRAVRMFGVLTRYENLPRGIIPSLTTLAAERGVSVDTVRRAVRELEKLGAVRIIERSDERGQTSHRYVLLYAAPPSTNARSPDVDPGSTTPTDPLAQMPPKPRQSEPTQSEALQSTSVDESSSALVPATKVAEDGWETARELCDYLADAIVESGGPGTKRPSVTQAWVATMEKVVRIDERTPTQVRAAIDWTHRAVNGSQGAWWQDKVLSPDALRRHYEKMRRQAQRRDTRSAPPGVELQAGYADAAARLRSRS